MSCRRHGCTSVAVLSAAKASRESLRVDDPAELVSEHEIAIRAGVAGGLALDELSFPVSLERFHGAGIEADRAVRSLRLALGETHTAAGRGRLLRDRDRLELLREPEPRAAEQFAPAPEATARRQRASRRSPSAVVRSERSSASVQTMNFDSVPRSVDRLRGPTGLIEIRSSSIASASDRLITARTTFLVEAARPFFTSSASCARRCARRIFPIRVIPSAVPAMWFFVTLLYCVTESGAR
jgi:hypothetical protein